LIGFQFTANPHLLVNQHTANGTESVGTSYFAKTALKGKSATLERLRADRQLQEALAVGPDPLHLASVFGLDPKTAIRYMAFCGASILRTDPDGPPRLISTHSGTVRLLRPPLTRRVSTQARDTWNVASSGHGLAAIRQGTRILLWNTSIASGKRRIQASFAGSIINRGYPRNPGMHLGGTYAQWVTSLAVSPDEKAIASGSVDGLIRVWDARTRRCGALLGYGEGHRSPNTEQQAVSALAFGTLEGAPVLASADRSGRVELWDFRREARIGRHDDHTDAIPVLGFASTSSSLISVSMDGTIRRWCLRQL
jgi:WD40 repeat protein